MAGSACAHTAAAAEGEGQRRGSPDSLLQRVMLQTHCAGAAHRLAWEASSTHCPGEVHPICDIAQGPHHMCVSARHGSSGGQVLPEKGTRCSVEAGIMVLSHHEQHCLIYRQKAGVAKMTNGSLARIIFAESHAACFLQ